MNVRGRVIPAIDLPALMGLGPSSIGAGSRIALVDVNDTLIGLIADEVMQILKVDPAAISPIALGDVHFARKYVPGVP
jgi:purine-binding chemotaxis protein CheW